MKWQYTALISLKQEKMFVMQYLLFICKQEGNLFMNFRLILCLWFLPFFFFFCAADRIDNWKWLAWDVVEATKSMHIFELRSFLISYFQTWHCVFTAAGAHCQLSLSHLQIEIDLCDCEPRARRWTLSDTEELPVGSVVTWSSVVCLFILQRTFWSDTAGVDANIMLC